jgi:hypothetical protein
MSRGMLRSGGLAAGQAAAVLVALGALAILAARHPWRIDLTEDRHNVLRPETLDVLSRIPAGADPVDIMVVTSLALAPDRDARQAELMFRPLVEKLAQGSQRVRASIVIAESQPDVAQRLRVQRVPLAVLHWKAPAQGERPAEERERRTEDVTEAGITNVLREILEGRRHVAYTLFGHGEMQRTDAGPDGFALATQLLEGANFEVKDLALVGNAEIPEDAELLLIAGPEQDLLHSDLEALGRYVARGGRTLLLLGPGREAGAFAELRRFLKEAWDVDAAEGVVADFDNPLGGNQVMLLIPPDASARHPIVKDRSEILQLPICRRVAPARTFPAGVSVDALFATGPRSWLETDVDSVPPRFDEGVDAVGPHPIAVAATRSHDGGPEARLVVVGCRHAFDNQFLRIAGNAELLKNAADWLAGKEQDLAARTEPGKDGTVVIPRKQGLIVLATMTLVPAVVAAAGIVTWWMRRRL